MIKDSKSHEKITLPPSTLLNPVPVVMISCAGKNPELPLERPNIMTVAWAGTVCSEPPMVSISVQSIRHSFPLIRDTGEFVINLVTEDLVKACDYCGVRSGALEDKFAALSLTAAPVEGLQYAPAILEAPLSLACQVVSVTELGSHVLFVAKILSVVADMNLFDKEGKLCLEDAGLVAYSHGEYYSLGKILGFFGHSVASPEAYNRRMKGKNAARQETSEISEIQEDDTQKENNQNEDDQKSDNSKPDNNRSEFKKSNYSKTGPRKPGISRSDSGSAGARKPGFSRPDSRDSRDSGYSSSSARKPGFPRADSRDSGFSSSGPRKPGFPRPDSRDSRDSRDSGSGPRKPSFPRSESGASGYASSGPRKPSFPRSESGGSGYASSGPRKPGFPRSDSRDSGSSNTGPRKPSYPRSDSRDSGSSGSGPRKPGFSKPGFRKPGTGGRDQGSSDNGSRGRFGPSH